MLSEEDTERQISHVFSPMCKQTDKQKPKENLKVEDKTMRVWEVIRSTGSRSQAEQGRKRK